MALSYHKNIVSPPASITSCASLDSQRCIVGTDDGVVAIVSLRTYTAISSCATDCGLISHIHVLHDPPFNSEYLLLLGAESCVAVYSIEHAKVVSKAPYCSGLFTALAPGNQLGEFLLTRSEGTVAKLTLETNTDEFFSVRDDLTMSISTISSNSKNLYYSCIAVSADHMFIGTFDGNVVVVNSHSRSIIHTLRLTKFQDAVQKKKTKTKSLTVGNMKLNIPSHKNVFDYIANMDTKLAEMAKTEEERKALAVPAVLAICYSPVDDVVFVTDSLGRLSIIDCRTFTIVQDYILHDGPCTGVIISEQTNAITCGLDGKSALLRFSDDSWNLIGKVQVLPHDATGLAEIDKRTLIYGRDGKFTIVRGDKFTVTHETYVLTSEHTITSHSLNTDEQIVSTLRQNSVDLWRLVDTPLPGKLCRRLLAVTRESIPEATRKRLGLFTSEDNCLEGNSTQFKYVSLDSSRRRPTHAAVIGRDDNSNSIVTLIRFHDGTLQEFTINFIDGSKVNVVATDTVVTTIESSLPHGQRSTPTAVFSNNSNIIVPFSTCWKGKKSTYGFCHYCESNVKVHAVSEAPIAHAIFSPDNRTILLQNIRSQYILLNIENDQQTLLQPELLRINKGRVAVALSNNRLFFVVAGGWMSTYDLKTNSWISFKSDRKKSDDGQTTTSLSEIRKIGGPSTKNSHYFIPLAAVIDAENKILIATDEKLLSCEIDSGRDKWIIPKPGVPHCHRPIAFIAHNKILVQAAENSQSLVFKRAKFGTL